MWLMTTSARMNYRKRHSESPLAASGKRGRSVLPVRKNTAWVSTSTSALLQYSEEPVDVNGKTDVDQGLGEAIAALLELSNDKLQIPEQTKQLLRQCPNEDKEAVVLFKSKSPRPTNSPAREVQGRGAATSSKQPLYGAGGLPSTSSGSDGSSTVVTPSLDRERRRSFESLGHPAGSGSPAHTLRQDSVHLNKEPLDVQISSTSALQSARDSNLSAQTTVPKLVIRVEEPAGMQPSMPPSVLAKPVTPPHAAWLSRGSSGSITGPATGLNVVSSGVPPTPLHAPEVLESSSLTKTTSLPSAQKQNELDAEAPDAAANAQPIASFHGGKLIVIATPTAGSQANTSCASQSGKLLSRHAELFPQRKVQTDFGCNRQAGKPLWQFSSTSQAATAPSPASGSSGDESSDELYQPNWGLDLFSALNPSVITTGHCTFKDSA